MPKLGLQRGASKLVDSTKTHTLGFHGGGKVKDWSETHERAGTWALKPKGRVTGSFGSGKYGGGLTDKGKVAAGAAGTSVAAGGEEAVRRNIKKNYTISAFGVDHGMS